MKRQRQPNWDQEDYSLDREFEDVTSLVRRLKSTPKVPNHLDRAIRQRLQRQAGHDLPLIWLLGPTLQLAMAATLLFGIGIMFVLSLEQQAMENFQSQLNARPTSISKRANPDDLLSGNGKLYSWARLTFIVTSSGKPQNISVLERCFKVEPGICRDDQRIDELAIQQVKSRQYLRSGQMEKIVFIANEQ